MDELNKNFNKKINKKLILKKIIFCIISIEEKNIFFLECIL